MSQLVSTRQIFETEKRDVRLLQELTIKEKYDKINELKQAIEKQIEDQKEQLRLLDESQATGDPSVTQKQVHLQNKMIASVNILDKVYMAINGKMSINELDEVI